MYKKKYFSKETTQKPKIWQTSKMILLNIFKLSLKKSDKLSNKSKWSCALVVTCLFTTLCYFYADEHFMDFFFFCC